MPLPWADTQLRSWMKEAENDICLRINLVLDRVSFATSVGQSEFTLPDYVNSIRRVTFQGFKIEASSFLDTVNSISSPSSVVSSSRPLNYVYDGFGSRVIKLFPSVGVNTVQPSGDLFNALAIASGLIAEVWRSVDCCTNNRCPPWFRRVIVRNYVLMKCLAQEGAGQDLNGSKYYASAYAEQLKVLKDVNSCVFLSRQNILAETSLLPTSMRNWRARPQLPPNFPQR